MIRLNKEQVNALVDKIYNEIVEVKITPIEEYNKVMEKSINENDFEIQMSKDADLIKFKEIAVRFGVNDDYYFRNIINAIISRNYRKYIKSISKEVPIYPVKEKIKNEIILATIEADNLNDLTESIKNKFL